MWRSFLDFELKQMFDLYCHCLVYYVFIIIVHSACQHNPNFRCEGFERYVELKNQLFSVCVIEEKSMAMPRNMCFTHFSHVLPSITEFYPPSSLCWDRWGVISLCSLVSHIKPTSVNHQMALRGFYKYSCLMPIDHVDKSITYTAQTTVHVF